MSSDLTNALRAEAGNAGWPLKIKALMERAADKIDELTVPVIDPEVEWRRFRDAWDRYRRTDEKN